MSSSGSALDHLLVNAALRDTAFEARMDYTKWPSDHYPLIGTFGVAKDDRLVFQWPRPCHLGHYIGDS